MLVDAGGGVGGPAPARIRSQRPFATTAAAIAGRFDGVLDGSLQPGVY